MDPAFFVSEFSGPILSVLIKQCFGADFGDIQAKVQVATLVEQLNKLNAKAIICEREYVDKDYAEDYANYYVQSFKDYRGSCARLHFFSNPLTQDEFSEILELGDPERIKLLSEGYLGFMVVKPLPFTFLGRTCIKQPSSQISKKYNVGLFGIRLSVESIAFQEQDRVVAACATTAVWSLLHALPETHNKQIPSPSAITLAATGAQSQHANSFPNKGLNLAQITAALDNFKLKQDSFSIDSFGKEDFRFLKKFSELYINSKIPVFLGARIYKRHGDSADEIYRCHGDHAVLLTGMHEKGGHCQFVVHDDRIGPSISVCLVSISLNSDGNAHVVEGETGLYAFKMPTHELMVPTAALAATYRKKRIGAEPIINTGEQLLSVLRESLSKTNADAFLEAAGAINFSASLRECHDLKSEYFGLKRTDTSRKALISHMPHFLWVVRYSIENVPIVDFLFDATDSPNGNPYLSFVVLDDVYGKFFVSSVAEIAKKMRVANEFDEIYCSINKNTINSFHVDVLRRLAPQGKNYLGHLDSMYGALRSPLYLRNNNFSSMAPSVLPGDEAGRYRFFSIEDTFGDDLLTITMGLIKASSPKNNGIWVIDEEGALILGPDTGHPNLTGASPARIAGEISVSSIDSNVICVNAKSGRYSGQYDSGSRNIFLRNARNKIASIFPTANIVAVDDSEAVTKQNMAPNLQAMEDQQTAQASAEQHNDGE